MLKYAVLTLALLFTVRAASAQETAPPISADADKASREKLNKQVRSLLDEALAAAPALKKQDNQFTIKATAAALLWTIDEPLARSLYEELLGAVQNALADPAPTGDSADDEQTRRSRTALLQRRRELASQLGRHDALRALEFLRATRHAVPADDPSNVSADGGELHSEIELAAQMVAQKPKEALGVVEANFARGYSPDMVNVLSEAAKKDRPAAAQLTGKMLAKLRASTLR